MQAGNDCSTNSLAQCPPTCHCEAPKGPWQSRRTRLDNRSLPAKTQPVAGDSHVASLLGMTNLGALHVHRECLHICNCQWRSLSAATDAIGLCVFIDALCELQVPSRDCHVGLRPPRNDNSEVHTVLTVARSYRQRCAGRGQPGPYSVRLAASRVTIHCPFSMIRFPAYHIICQGSCQSTGCSPFSCKKALICENGRLPKKPR